MGFAADSCREALKRCYGDVQQAINMLESCGGALSSLQQLTQGIDYLVSCNVQECYMGNFSGTLF